jgi:NAD(P)-dependent dehydrogenase (short-subunit alcohol dehydrogenase family)
MIRSSDTAMDLKLGNRHILITGGSKGIGLACARGFLAEGARVTIVSRSEANLSRARDTLGDVLTIAADLMDASAALGAIDRIEADRGAVDVLVTSAGAARRTPPDALTPVAWRTAMDAKFFSYINVIDPLIKRMAARGGGVIINIVGNGGKIASATHLAGGAANAALMLATAGLAHAYAAANVRVMAINPGLTNTGRVAEGMKAEAASLGITEADALKRSVSRIAMRRMAEPEEIAAVVVFAASAQASYLTGVTITMDGATVPTIV